MLGLGRSQEKPLSSASVGPCLFPAASFLGYLNFTFCVIETSEVTVFCLASTSHETHSCQSPLLLEEAGKLILLPSISPFCPAETQSRSSRVNEGLLSTLSFSLSHSGLQSDTHCLAGAHVLFAEFDPRHLKLI